MCVCFGGGEILNIFFYQMVSKNLWHHHTHEKKITKKTFLKLFFLLAPLALLFMNLVLAKKYFLSVYVCKCTLHTFRESFFAFFAQKDDDDALSVCKRERANERVRRGEGKYC
jgi:ABC-type long-subunit fatty acid transport system fused permease/ATPase subunit